MCTYTYNCFMLKHSDPLCIPTSQNQEQKHIQRFHCVMPTMVRKTSWENLIFLLHLGSLYDLPTVIHFLHSQVGSLLSRCLINVFSNLCNMSAKTKNVILYITSRLFQHIVHSSCEFKCSNEIASNIIGLCVTVRISMIPLFIARRVVYQIVALVWQVM